MSRVKNTDTKPEMMVRRQLRQLGYGYRLHLRSLPGSPDIVLTKYRSVIFVHGCFWHSHSCPRGKRPSTRTEFWDEKLSRNQARDAAAVAALQEQGWRVLVLWECQTKNPDTLATELQSFLPSILPNA